MKPIRMVDLAARHARLATEVEAAVLTVVRSGHYVGGPVVSGVVARLAAAFGWRHGVGVNSGTDALIYALQAVGVRPGDEVILPAVTFFATAGAVCRIGAVPVVVDIVSPERPLLDAGQIEIGPRTRAVIAVHLFGEPCPLPVLPLPVVDDSAQAIGADPPARTGIIAAASFYPTKTLGAYGDGGIVLTDDPETAEAVRLLTHHGMATHYHADLTRGAVGANSRLDAVQAAILGVHLGDVPRRVTVRRAYAARYDAELPTWVTRLPRSPGNPVHQYVVLCDRREQLSSWLAERGVFTTVYYPRTMAAQPALSGRARVPAPTPHADDYCARCLALPVHEELGQDEVSRVIEAFRSFPA